MMRNLFINYSINKVRRQYPNYSSDKIDEIKYGLEGLYILVTKSIIIFSVAILLNVIKELLILLLFFNILRLTGFGLHAKSSMKCLLSSTSIFIGLAFVSKYLTISFPTRLAISLVCFVGLAIFAPADTEKRPLVNKKKRCIYKTITITLCFIYTLLQIFVDNQIINNSLLFAMVIECLLVNPLSYRLLGLRYDNYKYY